MSGWKIWYEKIYRLLRQLKFHKRKYEWSELREAIKTVQSSQKKSFVNDKMKIFCLSEPFPLAFENL